jgi:TolA-binding protein
MALEGTARYASLVCGNIPARRADTSAMEQYELEEIRREIVESRALTIKTNNLVNALAADLKSIAKRQQGYERRFFVNSAAAYVVTITVLLVLVKFAWEAKLETVRADNKETRDKVTQLQKELKTAQSFEENSSKARREAAEFYELIAQNKRREIVERFPAVSQLPLTRTERAVFEDALERAQNELSLIAYQTGLEHVRTGRWHEAQQAMRESLRFKKDAAHSPQAAYQLARALRQLGQQREAIPLLMQLSEASPDREVMDDATLLLAWCQIDIQAWNDAKNSLRTFVRRFPTSPNILEAKGKLAELEMKY